MSILCCFSISLSTDVEMDGSVCNAKESVLPRSNALLVVSMVIPTFPDDFLIGSLLFVTRVFLILFSNVDSLRSSVSSICVLFTAWPFLFCVTFGYVHFFPEDFDKVLLLLIMSLSPLGTLSVLMEELDADYATTILLAFRFWKHS